MVWLCIMFVTGVGLGAGGTLIIKKIGKSDRISLLLQEVSLLDPLEIRTKTYKSSAFRYTQMIFGNGIILECPRFGKRGHEDNDIYINSEPIPNLKKRHRRAIADLIEQKIVDNGLERCENKLLEDSRLLLGE